MGYVGQAFISDLYFRSLNKFGYSNAGYELSLVSPLKGKFILPYVYLQDSMRLR